ncbi:Ww domain-containing oxidoreductase, partial [Globisporangium polare]
GALPTLYAATGPNVQGGDFIGRDGFLTMWGYPVLEAPSKESESESAAAKLWTVSEKLASLSFNVNK